ncbi:MAG: hypothetical protein ACOY3K_03765 [Candidatus Omnitrophota bacterium]
MKEKTSNFRLGIVVLVAAGLLQIAPIRREEDAIRKTQTDPIAYKKKMEEIKDGEKGAPAPPMEFYDKRTFLTEPPVEKEKKEEPLDRLPRPDEPIPEDFGNWEEDLWWQEDVNWEAEDWQAPAEQDEALWDGGENWGSYGAGEDLSSQVEGMEDETGPAAAEGEPLGPEEISEEAWWEADSPSASKAGAEEFTW